MEGKARGWIRFLHSKAASRVQGATRVSDSMVGQKVNTDFSIFRWT